MKWTNIPVNSEDEYKMPPQPTDDLDERRRNDLVMVLNLVASEGSTKAAAHLAVIKYLKDKLDDELEDAEKWTMENVSRTVHSAVAASRANWSHMFKR